MDWTFWVGLVGIVVILGVSRWAFTLRRRRDKMRGENQEVADAAEEARRAKERSQERHDGLGGMP